eukprot:TRINITY_DN6468_c0_g1_i1.p1 TRINITY_DN6468_c0_g1~~TRINITY_DN6468_c0_g1_i1.p1  ORF type:complete len:507 (-),score=91.74 TRINITY_DN6468_c0_g1_i1:63-1583(-)
MASADIADDEPGKLPDWIVVGPPAPKSAQVPKGDHALNPDGKAHLQVWFLCHLERPYPSDTDRVHLQQLSGLSDYQCMLWFSNTRRRNKKLFALQEGQIRILRKWLLSHLIQPFVHGDELQRLADAVPTTSIVVQEWLREARNIFRRFFSIFSAAGWIAAHAPPLQWAQAGPERVDHPPTEPSEGGVGEEGSGRANRALPKSSVQVLTDWYDTHAQHPYPTTEQQQTLITETGLTETQVLNWLANARRRSRRKAQQQEDASEDAKLATSAIANVITQQQQQQQQQQSQQPQMQLPSVVATQLPSFDFPTPPPLWSPTSPPPPLPPSLTFSLLPGMALPPPPSRRNSGLFHSAPADLASMQTTAVPQSLYSTNPLSSAGILSGMGTLSKVMPMSFGPSISRQSLSSAGSTSVSPMPRMNASPMPVNLSGVASNPLTKQFSFGRGTGTTTVQDVAAIDEMLPPLLRANVADTSSQPTSTTQKRTLELMLEAAKRLHAETELVSPPQKQ